VRRTSVEYYKRSGTGLRWQLQVLRPRFGIEDLGRQLGFADAVITLLQIHLVPARYELHAAVVDRRIFQRKPETDARLRFRVNIGRVLVANHLAADPRWLEDIHRLNDRGILEAK